jgi:hypothetical protein
MGEQLFKDVLVAIKTMFDGLNHQVYPELPGGGGYPNNCKLTIEQLLAAVNRNIAARYMIPIPSEPDDYVRVLEIVERDWRRQFGPETFSDEALVEVIKQFNRLSEIGDENIAEATCKEDLIKLFWDHLALDGDGLKYANWDDLMNQLTILSYIKFGVGSFTDSQIIILANLFSRLEGRDPTWYTELMNDNKPHVVRFLVEQYIQNWSAENPVKGDTPVTRILLRNYNKQEQRSMAYQHGQMHNWLKWWLPLMNSMMVVILLQPETLPLISFRRMLPNTS